MKLFFLISFIISFSFKDSLSRESAIEAVDTQNLRVCADPSNLPFSNDKGEGYENEIAELLGKKLGIPVIAVRFFVLLFTPLDLGLIFYLIYYLFITNRVSIPPLTPEGEIQLTKIKICYFGS